MESFVNTDLRNFGHEVGLLEQHQFAYSKFSLTTVSLLKVVDFWRFAIDDGLKSVCVFLDLRKAFDVIKLYILLAKLESYRIKGNALQLFNSYLLGTGHYLSSGVGVGGGRGWRILGGGGHLIFRRTEGGISRN